MSLPHSTHAPLVAGHPHDSLQVVVIQEVLDHQVGVGGELDGHELLEQAAALTAGLALPTYRIDRISNLVLVDQHTREVLDQHPQNLHDLQLAGFSVKLHPLSDLGGQGGLGSEVLVIRVEGVLLATSEAKAGDLPPSRPPRRRPAPGVQCITRHRCPRHAGPLSSSC